MLPTNKINSLWSVHKHFSFWHEVQGGNLKCHSARRGFVKFPGKLIGSECHISVKRAKLKQNILTAHHRFSCWWTSRWWDDDNLSDNAEQRSFTLSFLASQHFMKWSCQEHRQERRVSQTISPKVDMLLGLVVIYMPKKSPEQKHTLMIHLEDPHKPHIIPGTAAGGMGSYGSAVVKTAVKLQHGWRSKGNSNRIWA